MSKNKFQNNYSKLESSEQTQRYVKEMYDLADTLEHKSNLAFISIAVPIIVIVTLTIVQMFSFTFKVAKSHSNNETKLASTTTANTNNNTINTNSSQQTTNNKINNNSKDNTSKKESSIDTSLIPTKLHSYLEKETNRKASFSKAKKLNGGKEKGLASIYMSQILRDNGIKIDNSIINTEKLVKTLAADGWKKSSDYKQLQKGDICFSTSPKTSSAPAHTYIFMGWVKEGKTDYAYVVDSQISEYSNTYHKRNIDFVTPKKEKFGFFMRKQ